MNSKIMNNLENLIDICREVWSTFYHKLGFHVASISKVSNELLGASSVTSSATSKPAQVAGAVVGLSTCHQHVFPSYPTRP